MYGMLNYMAKNGMYEKFSCLIQLDGFNILLRISLSGLGEGDQFYSLAIMYILRPLSFHTVGLRLIFGVMYLWPVRTKILFLLLFIHPVFKPSLYF